MSIQREVRPTLADYFTKSKQLSCREGGEHDARVFGFGENRRIATLWEVISRERASKKRSAGAAA